ncbi:MAG: hypothetical protein CSA47_00615 [Gammaproteobacteria bacterium]|nr:MAG: hypothetical protein CSA47_00615 [Gammaproteobacteria bacterium]
MIFDNVILSFDLIGTAASAVAATILAQRKGLDYFGALLIGAVAAVGGGTVRDLLLNKHPVFWLVKPIYLLVIVSSVTVTLFFYRYINKMEKPLRVFDAVGLAAFTVIGVEIALLKGMSPFIAVIMGVITSTFGGISRDIICNEIPLVLHKEIYITASIVGSCCLLLLMHLELHRPVAFSAALAVIFSVRMIAVYKDLRLPRFHQIDD